MAKYETTPLDLHSVEFVDVNLRDIHDVDDGDDGDDDINFRWTR